MAVLYTVNECIVLAAVRSSTLNNASFRVASCNVRGSKGLFTTHLLHTNMA